MARVINRIIIHCSDSPDTQDIGLAEIEKWHKERFGGIVISGVTIHCGYHYIVRRSGLVEVGRPEKFTGAHAQGHNNDSIGICWVGRNVPAPKQMIMLLGLVRNVMLRYGLTASNVIGHREVNPMKTCPNIDMIKFRADLSVSIGDKT